MAVLRANVEFAKRILADRVGNEYVYGGNWNPFNVKFGTDCSGLVVDILDATINGTAMAWTRHGMSTESWRPIDVGQVGPFGTICVAKPSDFPPDAAVKIAIHHGPGGGANSHTWCEVDSVRGESNGTDGCVTGARARNVYDTSYANDWHYLPGPIVGVLPQPQPPQLSRAERYALAIIVEGRNLGISPRGIKIALSVALVESNLTMYANSNVPESLAKNPDGSDKYPHEKVGSDHDSTGLFQQRQAWGPLACTMNATCSAGLFYNGGNAGQRGLTDFDYNNMANSPGVYAQRVQVSAFPDRYDQRFVEATALYDKLSTPAEQPTEGFLMALSDQEQRKLYDALMNQRPSRSPLRHLVEGNVGDAPDQVWDMDGSIHVLIVELLARLGDPDTLGLLQEVAGADVARFPDRAHDKQLAQAILNKIMAQKTAAPLVMTASAADLSAAVAKLQADTLPALLPAPVAPPAPVVQTPPTDDDYIPRHAKGSSVGDMVAALRLAARFKKTPEIAEQASTLVDALEGYQP